jgi:1D-myo-inositol-tetrakisphosphate 5-kinase/inositol-polyphosphate multikinase
VYNNSTGQPVQTDKHYGKSLKPDQLSEGVARIFPCFERDGNGLSASTLTAILARLLADLREVRSALARVELRVVGGSVLVVYEGLEERAVEGVKRMEEQDAKGDDEENEDEEDSEDDDEKKAVAYKVKLIDFAHTRLVPGQGPDEGVLLGLDTLSRLVEERIMVIRST